MTDTLDKLQTQFNKAFNTQPPTTTIKVFVGDKLVGAIQSLTIKGTDVNPKIETTRIRFDRTKIAEAFSRGFVHPHAQILPLQIEIEDNEVITKCKNVWTENNDKKYQSYMTTDWVLTEYMDLIAEAVESKKK